MSGAAFLLIAVAVGVLGSLYVMARHRGGPRSSDAMAEFRREMDALAPPQGHRPDPGPRLFPHRPYPGVTPRPDDDRSRRDDDRSRPDAGSGAR